MNQYRLGLTGLLYLPRSLNTVSGFLLWGKNMGGATGVEGILDEAGG